MSLGEFEPGPSTGGGRLLEGSLRDKTVVVTGAASGIGAAVAALAAREGARVIGLDRNATGDQLVVDLAVPSSIEAVVDALPERIDALLNVAGVPGTLPPATVLAVNFLGLRQLTELLRPRLAGGAVVSVASTAGAQWAAVAPEIDELLATGSMAEGLEWYAASAPQMPAYNFSKAALIRWTMGVAFAWRAQGPRVCTVSPGAVETPILGDFRESMGPVLGAITRLLGRDGRPEDVAAAVCFLATEAATWINGVDLVVDGGFSGAMLAGAVDLTALMGGERG
jgi:NAD(P)-dependent dehydrogenase (short-subunit alcohol dehydrogenase family)